MTRGKIMARRVVITGIGLVTPLGVGKEAFAAALWRGGSAIGEVTAFPTAGLGSHLAAEVRGFEGRDFISLKNLRKMDRLSAMTAAAARMALDDAGLAVTEENRDRIGIVMGTAYGNSDLKVQSARTLFTEGPAMMSPLHVPNTVMNAPAGHASIELGFRGVNTTVNHQAVSGETAIACGAMEIRRGAAEAILAGGAEILSPFLYEALTRYFALSPGRGGRGGAEGARPFDRSRNGFVLGEGCGLLCLEEAGHAAARGATVLAEIAGWGLASSPTPSTAWPDDPRGVVLAVTKALKMAALSEKDNSALSSSDRLTVDIDVIHGAANGGREPDALEAKAFDTLFAGADQKPLITALKGATGEIFAGGGIRAAALVLSLREGIVPPIVGLADPLSGLPFVQDEPPRRPLRRGLLSGISSGGACVGLVLIRP
jgi:3-oxoacyl-[acyl-carrier-protein] synthase II